MPKTRLCGVGVAVYGTCLCSDNGRCRTWRCRGCRISVFSARWICLPLRDRSCRLKRLTKARLCRRLCRATRTFGGLCATRHRLVSRWAARHGDKALLAERSDHSRHRAYQKLWISLIIKSITLSKAILTMNMYIIAHQFIFKIICLDNIKLLAQFMC